MYKIAGLILVILISLGSVSSCSNAKKIETTSIPEAQKPQQKLYLMLRLAQRGDTSGLRIVDMEKKVFADGAHALPLPPEDKPGVSFRCEVLDGNEKVIQSKELKSEFKYGTPESGPEAIVKFIFPLADGAISARVSRKIKDGVWEEILTTPIDR